MDKKNYYYFSGLALSFILLLGGCSSTPEATRGAPVYVKKQVVEPQPSLHRAVVKKPVQIRPDYPQRYTVVMGDTLWDISSRFLKDAWRWPEVWQNNPQVDNPHLIYPGDVLVLHYINGVPYIKVERPDSYPTVKLSPQLREESINSAIVTIPTDAISSFLITPHVVSRDELERAPYVVSSIDGHLIAGVENTLYIRNLGNSPHSRYTIVRKGKPYINPGDDEILGYEATYIAEGTILRRGDPASLKVNYAKREILNGDRLLLSEPQQADRSYHPRASKQRVDAQIISVVDGVSMIGQYHVVVLNLGQQDRVAAGDVLAVYRSGSMIRDSLTSEMVELPEERSGVVMIFRVFDRVSYALVMDATVPLRIHDRVTNP